MRTLRLVIILAFFSTCIARAQVSVDLQLDQDQYLPNEAMTVKVRITNQSGQSVKLGVEQDWLTFRVAGNEGKIAPQIERPMIQQEFISEPGTTVSVRVDLGRYYGLSESGRYRLTAAVHVQAWDQTFESKPKTFDISPGSKMWEMVFGVPKKTLANRTSEKALPETRKYILQRSVNLKAMRLYLRLTDPNETRNYRVFPIAPMVSFTSPEAQLDADSNLHVLHQTGARSFNYSIINPDGEMIERQTYEYTASRPVLRLDKAGKLTVVGGVRKKTSSDIPLAGPEETKSSDAKGAQ